MKRPSTLRVLSPVLAAALALAGTSSAQAPPLAELLDLMPVEWNYDTGSVENDGTERQAIISFPVHVDEASSLTLRFQEVVLAGEGDDASILRITSMLDGAVQTMNATHVEQWDDGTAYFNGDMVIVEVIASPRTGPNRVVVDEVHVGAPMGAFETQCGPNDDRTPSNDQRVCRLMPVACTAWVINDASKCVLSAGHCGASGSSSIQFNVPFSTSGGGLVFPPPKDQYAVDGASMQTGTADDWRYFGVFPNSNTGLTPYEAYGVAFDLQPAPTSGSNNIRITGHGTDFTPNSTYNQVQQTHVGPLVGVGSSLSYQTDTTGGNSGSPVIWEEMDVAVGIHTNGGCSTGGGGANFGTPITHFGLQAALMNPLGVCQSPPVFSLSSPQVTPMTPAGPTVVSVLGVNLENTQDVIVAGDSVSDGTTFDGEFVVVDENQVDIVMPLASQAGVVDIEVVTSSGSSTEQIEIVPGPPALMADEDFIIQVLGFNFAVTADPGDVVFLLVSPFDGPTVAPGLFDWDIGGGQFNSIHSIKTWTIGPKLWRKTGFGPFSGLPAGADLHFQGWVLRAADGFSLPGTTTNTVTLNILI